MSFETELLSALGTASDSYDIKAVVRRCFFYDFDGIPVRLWDGQGVLTAGGQEWHGTIDAAGTNHHVAPAVRDGRDGTSPRYNFRIPYLDQATFIAMKADQSLAVGREMTCYHALFLAGTPRVHRQDVEWSDPAMGSEASLRPIRFYQIPAR